MVQVLTEENEREIPVRDERAWTDISERSHELAVAVLSGDLTIEEAEDLAREDTRFGGPLSLAGIGLMQDAVAQVGQGVIRQRDENEHLGRSDMGLIMWRKLWTRELRALAEGRPLKQRPPGGVARTGTWPEPGRHASLPPRTD